MREPGKPTVWDLVRDSWLLIMVFGGIAVAVGLLLLYKPSPLPSKDVDGKIISLGSVPSAQGYFKPIIVVRLNDGTTRDIRVSSEVFEHCEIGKTVSLVEAGINIDLGADGCAPRASKPIAGSH